MYICEKSGGGGRRGGKKEIDISISSFYLTVCAMERGEINGWGGGGVEDEEQEGFGQESRPLQRSEELFPRQRTNGSRD